MSHWANDYAAEIAENVAEGILVTDGGYWVVQANQQAADLLGATRAEELIGRHVGGGGEEDAIQFVPKIPEGGVLTTRDGRYSITTSFRADVKADVLFPSAENKSDFQVLILNGVPDLSQIDQNIFQSEKLAAMDNVVAGVAHELNNPMTAILGYAELLLATEENGKRKKRIALIAEEADRCGKIIANMLSFTRSFGNDFEFANVGALLEEVVSLRAYQMRVDGVEIHSDVASDIPEMAVQPSAMRRLFLNIVHNAHQALLEVPEAKREFWFSASLEDDRILIKIADSGPGISEDVRYNIFDPFFTTRSLGEGMGLGLSVAYGIVQEHHGKITMEPQENGGTSINIELPVRREP